MILYLDFIKLTALIALREKPAGTIRITTNQHAAETVLWPALSNLLPDYPDVRVELSIDPALTDIVPERYDAGVRIGEQVAKDMIAVRVGPDLRMAVVGAPSYFAGRRKPKTPRDLTRHRCIKLRLPTLGGLYPWEFERNGREVFFTTKSAGGGTELGLSPAPDYSPGAKAPL